MTTIRRPTASVTPDLLVRSAATRPNPKPMTPRRAQTTAKFIV